MKLKPVIPPGERPGKLSKAVLFLAAIGFSSAAPASANSLVINIAGTKVEDSILKPVTIGGGKLLIADYRNSYSSPYGDTYESIYGQSRRPYYPYTQTGKGYPLNRNSAPASGSQYQFNQLNNTMPAPRPGSKPVSPSRSNQSSDWLNIPTNRPPPWTTRVKKVPAQPASGGQAEASSGVVNEVEESGKIEVPKAGGPIKVEISHSDYLPSLPPALHKGSQFEGWSNTGLPKSRKKKGVEKFLIPKWLAGQWQRTRSTETKRIKLPEGKPLKTTGTTVAKTVDSFGTYLDGSGKIWQVFNPKRAVGEVDRGDVMDHHRVMKYKIEILSPKSVCVEVTASHLVVTKKKHRIVKSFQDEELNTYTILPNGQLKTESSVKVFDQLGKPVLLTHSVSNVSKIQSAK